MRRSRHSVLPACALLVFLASPAHATSLTLGRTASNVDWVSAGVGGIPGDTADIAVSGVTGTVTKAYLYWDGMNITNGNAVYANETIAINGNVVTGTSLGDSSSNCWGDGSSRAFFADVTPYVAGDGTYSLSGLAAQAGNNANGASLVVLFDDGDPTNNRDLIFFEGNDSTSLARYGGIEDNGFHDLLDGILYSSGTVRVQFHVADGQSTNDGTVTFHAPIGPLSIPDTSSLWDGASVPVAGISRASGGEALWDIHTFDISSLFPAHGTYQIYVDSDPLPADCIALVLAVVELAPGSGSPVQICGDGVLTAPEECDDGNLVDGDCCDSNCHVEPAGTVCGNPGDPCLESRCDGAGACDAEGRSCRMPIEPEAGLLVLRHGKRDRLTWTWSTGTSTMADFGDPLATTAYDLCLYDKGTGALRLLGRTSVSAGGSCAGAPCWNATPKSYEYQDPAGPLQWLTLHGSNLPGMAKIVAQSAGPDFSLPSMPLAPPVMVRLRARNGLCWGVNYSFPERNGRRRFSSRGDYFYP